MSTDDFIQITATHSELEEYAKPKQSISPTLQLQQYI